MTPNCIEELQANVRASLRRQEILEEIYKTLFFITLGAIFGTLIAIGMKQ